MHGAINSFGLTYSDLLLVDIVFDLDEALQLVLCLLLAILVYIF